MEDAMSNHKELVMRQYTELINHKNLAVIDADMHPEFVDHSPSQGQSTGLEHIKQWMSYLLETVPDLEVTVDDLLEEGDRVAVRATWKGSHTGPLQGYTPTGQRFTFQGMVFWRIQDGKIRERWAVLS
jgi:steroid delta-isomerase-like uncharacterized protein